jgi:hypothetical protein
MFILDFFLAVFALAPFGLLVLFWKVFHEDRGVHPIYRNSTDGNRIGQNSVVCSGHGR